MTAVDASFGKGVGSDYSAVVTVAADGGHFHVLDARRGRWEFAELLATIERATAEHGPEAVLVEDAGAGQSAIQQLRRSSALPVVAVKPRGSKVARAEAVSPLFEAGRVLFPVNAGWRDELIEELAGFPAGRHDDQVDALVYALDRLRTVSADRTVVHVITKDWRDERERREPGYRRSRQLQAWVDSGLNGTGRERLSYAEAKRRNPGWTDPRYE